MVGCGKEADSAEKAGNRNMKVSTCIMGKFALILVFFNSSLILFYLVMYSTGRADTRMNNFRLSQILDNQGSHQYDVMPSRDNRQETFDVQIGRRHINGVFENVNGSFDDFGQRSMKHDGTENPKTKTALNKNKFLVYLCNKQKLCGGWGVRQAGIISTFLLANLTNRMFKVSMTSPCKLQHFLIPNQLNWVPDIEELRGKSLSVINDVHNSSVLDVLRWKNFNMYYSQDIVFVRATMDFTGILTQNPVYIKQVSQITTQTQSATFKDNWDMLMAPSIQTQTVLQDILALNNRSVTRYEDLICAHVKLGSDPRTENVQNILRILQQWTGMNPKVFIATDSDYFRSISRSSFGDKIMDSGGTVLNIDTDRGTIDSCLGLRTVILDQMILSRCRLLALSYSGVGRNTAFLRGTNKNVLIFVNGHLKHFTNNNDVM
ncbi:uncharacterized protein LOC124264145 [Haliotis rubra]|uniref:uncharacterized protein LOC124264145 n=1 Tax=Haliotis rubra TaxID=36100 RepID=UPI001EE52D4F|nr:uncharacterized protein LOC124264145 [Haliotis rubra]XP_046554838.1 uncharacterized protein LOC124264145 [Haliotis rubra]XP_046554839.1 uncharacterized protein LOC124264145 [Haliotis rubra]